MTMVAMVDDRDRDSDR